MTDRRRWVVLAVGTSAQASTSTFVYGMPMLVPQLRAEGFSLFSATLLVSAPVAGVLVSLVAWGAATDRFGERIVVVGGVGAATALLAGAALTPPLLPLAVALLLAGIGGASVNAASGRMIMGWFPRQERGFAMGVRQTGQPLGVALAGLALPTLARDHGVSLALLYPAALCLVATLAVLAFVVDPPRALRTAGSPPVASPYCGSPELIRVHLTSGLLVVPQFAVATFTLAYLVSERGGDPAAAGHVVVAFQVASAVGRVAAGVWSDRVGSRLRPIRQLAAAAVAVMLAIAAGAATGSWFVVVGFAVGALVTVADNGLAYTSVAETAGSEWSGRALGIQNTVQNAVAVAVVPLLGVLIGATGYAVGFAVVAVFPLLAVPLTPVRTERRVVTTG